MAAVCSAIHRVLQPSYSYKLCPSVYFEVSPPPEILNPPLSYRTRKNTLEQVIQRTKKAIITEQQKKHYGLAKVRPEPNMLHGLIF